MQCCPDLPEPTFHKKIIFEILAHSTQTTLHIKTIYNFVWINKIVDLGQHCIRKLLAPCWPRVHRSTFAGKLTFSNMSVDLFFNRAHYQRTILALFIQCWLRSSFTAFGTIMNRGRH